MPGRKTLLASVTERVTRAMLIIPWVVEIVLTPLDQQDLKLVVQVGQSTSNYTAGDCQIRMLVE